MYMIPYNNIFWIYTIKNNTFSNKSTSFNIYPPILLKKTLAEFGIGIWVTIRKQTTLNSLLIPIKMFYLNLIQQLITTPMMINENTTHSICRYNRYENSSIKVHSLTHTPSNNPNFISSASFTVRHFIPLS